MFGTIGLVLAVLLGIAAAALLLFTQQKMIAGLLAALAAIFLALNFYSDQVANREAGRADFRAAEADFRADWAKATGEPKKRQDSLQKRADELAEAAEVEEVNRKEVTAANAQARKPLAEVMEREVNKTATQLEGAGQPKTNFQPGEKNGQ